MSAVTKRVMTLTVGLIMLGVTSVGAQPHRRAVAIAPAVHLHRPFDGIFKCSSVVPGGHAITFRLEGVRTVTREVYVRPDSTFKMNTTMERLASGETNAPSRHHACQLRAIVRPAAKYLPADRQVYLPRVASHGRLPAQSSHMDDRPVIFVIQLQLVLWNDQQAEIDVLPSIIG